MLHDIKISQCRHVALLHFLKVKRSSGSYTYMPVEVPVDPTSKVRRVFITDGKNFESIERFSDVIFTPSFVNIYQVLQKS